VVTLQHELEKCWSWNQGQGTLVEAARRALLDHPEGTPELVARAEDRARRSSRALARFYDLGRNGQRAQFRRELAEFLREFRHLATKAEQRYQSGAAARLRATARYQNRAQGRPLSSIVRKPGEPAHRIQDQASCDRWVLVVDETGRIFKLEPQGPRPDARHLGRFVGILSPEDLPAGLPHRPDFHAVDEPSANVDRVVQDLLHAPVGIFGHTLFEVPPAAGERWSTGVLQLVDWVLRLLPLPATGSCRLRVLVEQRAEYQAGSEWSAAAAELLRQLAMSDPQRYGRVELSLEVVGKGAHPFMGYADAVAYTWGSPTPESQERLARSGLLGLCLHKGDVRELRRSWDLLQRGQGLDGRQWQVLLASPDLPTPGSIPALLAERLGEAAQQSPARWQRFVTATREHLDGKAVNLRALGTELAWLERWAPPAVSLPPRLRLAWAVVQLETANHHGQIEAAALQEIATLADQLFDEDPTLVCQAELDRAVLFTNRFEFREARQSLARWADHVPAVPGLRHWGRVLSSLGQHAAFLGEPAEAVRLFDAALAAFDRLSDVDVGSAERSQTANYRAIALLDDPAADPARRRAAVAELVDLAPEAIGALAVEASPARKYAHHLLLRYLVSAGSPAEREAYLAEQARWQEDVGHPWELILAYRALLLRERDPAAATRLLARAAAHCAGAEEGPTLAFISAALAVAAGCWDPAARPDEQELEWLLEQLPAAEAQIAVLRSFATSSPAAGPLEVLRAALPFNFR